MLSSNRIRRRNMSALRGNLLNFKVRWMDSPAPCGELISPPTLWTANNEKSGRDRAALTGSIRLAIS